MDSVKTPPGHPEPVALTRAGRRTGTVLAFVFALPLAVGGAGALVPAVPVFSVAAAVLPDPGSFEGLVVDAESGASVAAATVFHVDRAGQRVQGTFTDAQGRFNLRAVPRVGDRIEVERLGYAPLLMEISNPPDPDGPPLVLRMTVRPLALEGIEVGRGEICTMDPAEAPRTDQLWEAARTSLRAAEMSEAEALVRYRAEVWTRRELLIRGYVVPDFRADTLEVVGRPFQTLPPALLATRGYVSRSGREQTARGPDASTFLSSSFLAAHCFRVAESSREARGLVGLAFEPVEDRDIVQISGVFWMEPGSGELRRVDFTFLHLVDGRWEGFGEGSGGQIAFRALDDGRRVVESWELRLFTEFARPGRPMFDQAGGQLLRVLDGPPSPGASPSAPQGAPPGASPDTSPPFLPGTL